MSHPDCERSKILVMLELKQYKDASPRLCALSDSDSSNKPLMSIYAYSLYADAQYQSSASVYQKIMLNDKLITSFYAQCLYKLGKTQEAANISLLCPYNNNISNFIEELMKTEYSITKIQSLLCINQQQIFHQLYSESSNNRFFDYYTHPDYAQKLNSKLLYEIVLESAKSVLHDELFLEKDANSCISKIIQTPNSPYTFHTIDVTRTVERFMTWAQCFGRVVPFYAVKSNPDPIIIMSYAILGTGFDCASETELKLVLSLGVHPDRIIYAQPRKFETDLIYAKKCGIKKLVFDSKDELIKIHEIYPEGEYILRIKTLNPHNTSVYNTKFGANYEYAKELIKIAAGMKANLIGISFNIGTNVNFVDCYQKAISDVSELFAEAKKYNISMNFLDLGGGWVGINDSIFEKITSTITAEIQKHFDPSIRIIAEPGRFMAAEVEQQVVRIIGMDEVGSEPIMHYYLSNGTYQSFFVSVEHHYDKDEIISDGISLQPFNRIVDPNEPLYKSVLWGPTCDSGDKVIEGIMLPKLKRGDYLYSLHTGAYNNAESTNFNGIKKSKPYYYYCPFK